MSNLTNNTTELQEILEILQDKVVGGGNDEGLILAKSLIDRSATKIVIPDGVTDIGNYAFCNFNYLTEVVIPNTVKFVRYRAFYACPLLTHITFPASVENFLSGQHFHSSGVTTLTFEGTTPPFIVANSLVDSIQTIYVPASAVDTYKSATNWSAYASKIVGI